MKPKYFIHLTIEFFYFGEEYVDNLHVVSLFLVSYESKWQRYARSGYSKCLIHLLIYKMYKEMCAFKPQNGICKWNVVKKPN